MNLINTVNKLDSHTLEVLAKSAPSILATLAAIFIDLLGVRQVIIKEVSIAH